MPKDTLESVNLKISGLNLFGSRKETAKYDGFIITWSNAFKKWNRAYYRTVKTKKIILEANQVLAYTTKDRIDLWIYNKKLINLPLYSNSFESKQSLKNLE